MLDAVIGLGSNLGDRADHLVRAAQRIRELGNVLRTSALYETSPVGPPQPDYLNAALRLETNLEPAPLLQALLDVEQSLGRVRHERWGARTIDLDVLWCRDVAVAAEGLVVPHAELRVRAFALLPLLDVAPDARDPRDLVPYSEIVSPLDTSSVREVPGTRGVWLL